MALDILHLKCRLEFNKGLTKRRKDGGGGGGGGGQGETKEKERKKKEKKNHTWMSALLPYQADF